jgi:4-diphosphocytidyl-2-C-methyl-D-erythritol kinase
MLSVHGPRGDGFHDLTSLVVPLEFGDRLQVALNQGGGDRLSCSDPAVPTDGSNLILRAAKAFRAALRDDISFDFNLDKRIPMGAGLGGGSSNAAIALNAMNALAGSPFDEASLIEMSAELGSDCPLFIQAKPTLMMGRGEQLEALTTSEATRLIGKRVVLFRPDFAVNTAWAYRQLVDSSPSAYEAKELSLERIHRFQQGADVQELLFNSFEAPVGRKYLAIPCLLGQLRAAGHACLMSGSGSCCFAFVDNDEECAAIRKILANGWGSQIFFIETSIC